MVREIKVKLTIEPNGEVASANITDATRGTPVAGCVTDSIGSMKFPSSVGGGAFTVSLPLRKKLSLD
jgi:hypothetical protein